MSKVLMVVFLIFGTVVGAGFSSGNEIVVFFSRFGWLSYLYIIFAGFLLFWIFYFFLTNKISAKLNSSKTLSILNFFISLVFCASMFAGIDNLFRYFPSWVYFVLLAILFVLCVFITLKGVSGIEKANFVLMPWIAVAFFVVLMFALCCSSEGGITVNSWAGFLYSPLYVALNTCMSGYVVSQAGETMTKRQAFWASVLASVLLVVFLLITNFVLIKNSASFESDMPILEIVKHNKFMFVLAFIVILVGCWTTLISLTLTIKTSFDKLIKNNLFSAILAVLVPFLLSVIGFSQIVSMLYPICSVLGIFMLVYCLCADRFK